MSQGEETVIEFTAETTQRTCEDDPDIFNLLISDMKIKEGWFFWHSYRTFGDAEHITLVFWRAKNIS